MNRKGKKQTCRILHIMEERQKLKNSFYQSEDQNTCKLLWNAINRKVKIKYTEERCVEIEDFIMEASYEMAK